MPILVAVGAVLLIVVLIGWLRDSAERRRANGLRKRAEQLGFMFSKEGDNQIVKSPSRFLLFSQGVSAETRYVMRHPGTEEAAAVQNNAPDLALFEYVFTVPFGRYYQNWIQTIARLAVPTFSLPTFSVMPQAVFDALATRTRDKELRERLLGTAGLKFAEHPSFAEKHHVQAYDRVAVQALITDELIGFFERHDRLCMEASDTTVLLYRFDTLTKAADLPAFIDEAEEALRLLEASQREIDRQTSDTANEPALPG